MCKILLALGFLVAGLNLAHAETDAVDELVDFLAGQGCAIGPATRDAAIAAGFTAEEIDAYAGAALSEGSAAREGEWVVLPPETCEIRPPEITPAIKLSDPEVMAAISAIDEYEGDPGCFLDREKLDKNLTASRDWDANMLFQEYIRLVAASLISGDMTFYSDTPLATPVGFSFLGGECSKVPQMNEIRQGHDFIIENFDAIVRELGSQTICEHRASPHYTEELSNTKWLTNGDTPNAWFGFEVMIIAFGAGWQEGMTDTEKGMPRPPMCHYE